MPPTRMPESHTTGLGHDASVSVEGEGQMGFIVGPSPRQAKHWAKKYRTEIAASSSSVLSTFVAVSITSFAGSECWLEEGEWISLTWVAVSSGLRQDSNASVSDYSNLLRHRRVSHGSRKDRYRFNHFTDCVQHTYKTERFKGFWRG